ncbi:class I SAM-dependent methyltransferase [Phaeovulum vinaykumarii]|uniref:Methyltransferase domain-containing protein n=1 Tax=Phaeovulum vinaykumarii TaxID=407234 RepID=A0A1N7MBL9_9RHOB|nr:class I SAM-dependent methyltransferase [Phaeovulum vinaykumarii]SIS83460.1 Methyltransferase domain-containing protein [Phaeovulum vinaykumarii]SOC10204.1 methyltransferase family protein [Phaeovulum vinaykumarii]
METSRRAVLRGKLLQMMPKGAKCAEIGVWEGGFSERILAETEPAELHLIDPWLYMPEFSNTGFGRRKNKDLMEGRYEMVVDKFKDDPRVHIHRATSAEGMAELPDGSLDWVYIDGNHNEPFINEDLEICLQKVKPDGIISGDDYHWQTESLGAPVKRAVDAVMERLGDTATIKVMANQYFIQLNRS